MVRTWVFAASLILASALPASAAESETSLLRRLARLESQVKALKTEVARRQTKHAAPDVAAARASPSGEEAVASAPAVKPLVGAGPYLAAFGAVSRSVANSEPNAPYIGEGLNPSALNPSAAGLALGYNFRSGDLMFGLETAWRYDFGGAAKSSSTSVSLDGGVPSGPLSQNPLPVNYNCYYGSACINPTNFAGPTLALGNIVANSEHVAERGGGELVGRIGARFADWTPYVRFGGGASLFLQQEITTNSEVRCNQPVGQFYGTGVYGLYNGYTLQSCGALQTVQTSRVVSTQSVWLPYFIVGVGLEADFGRYFARAEANAAEFVGTSNSLGLNNAFARYDARLGLGLRF